MAGNAEALREWYNSGADGQIDWGQDGDFMQCVNIAAEHMDEDDAKGFCNERHQDAVGGAPGTEKLLKYSPDQARDSAGRWADSGGEHPAPGTVIGHISPAVTPGQFMAHRGTTVTDEGWEQFRSRDEAMLHIADGRPLDLGLRSFGRSSHEVIVRDMGQKNISLGSPLATGLVPYDLVGQGDPTPRCDFCGARGVMRPDSEGWSCPNGHGMFQFRGKDDVVAKFDPDQPRDDAGRWTSVGGLTVTDEGILGDVDSRGGESTIKMMEHGLSPNVKPDAVKGIMQAALAHKFDKPVDLDHLRVQGTRQFGADGLHVPRTLMPQIPYPPDQFFDFLKGQGISVTPKQVDPQSLQPTQSEISLERTAGVYQAILAGDPKTTGGIISSQDQYVIDGHHRWSGYTAVSFEQPGTKMNTYEIGMDARPLIDLANKWTESQGIAHANLTAKPDLVKAILAEIDAELGRRGVKVDGGAAPGHRAARPKPARTPRAPRPTAPRRPRPS